MGLFLHSLEIVRVPIQQIIQAMSMLVAKHTNFHLEAVAQALWLYL
jgi:hypothetical protein